VPKEDLLVHALPVAVLVWGMVMRTINGLKITITVERQ
jgi:hypothetical protein